MGSLNIGMFDRQDSLRSDYMSDRETSRYGIVQQASIESADSRLCYLTSSEVSFPNINITNSVCNSIKNVCSL
ncbi:hypothetical protein NQ314_021333 [Rhamnusium bicolor]|uniref:Uncharacterized protein n=1 Tax=Rhamnusium bicolor TaxID=1586634 RepID=A0AAV8WJ72_9CUCU|nr:hypothetical protein NQ314_021333 [Rhamnusium bicolor]